MSKESIIIIISIALIVILGFMLTVVVCTDGKRKETKKKENEF